jgi:hypothetical protein
VTLLSKGTQDEATEATGPVHFGSAEDLPVDRRLVFFLKSKVPSSFPRDEKIEVSSADGSFHTALSLADGTLLLEDATTAMGIVEPLARFGPSAFGPVEARAVAVNGAAGDWLPLGTLVRTPTFKELRCPRALTKPCSLTGNNLFLATAIAATSAFDELIAVPPDFTGTQLTVPHPTAGTLYLKLRDDPTTVQTLTLPILPTTAASVPPLKLPDATHPVEPQPDAPKPATPDAPPDQVAPPAPSPGVHP